jgi:hypothetical protein
MKTRMPLIVPAPYDMQLDEDDMLIYNWLPAFVGGCVMCPYVMSCTWQLSCLPGSQLSGQQFCA